MSLDPTRSRIFWPATVALLGVMGAVQFRSAALESATFDEASHLACGYSYLRTGDYRMGIDHTPLGNILNALPLLALNPRLPLNDKSWTTGDHWGFGNQFFYSNVVSADVMLACARSATIALTLALGLFLAIWTRRHFGAGPALLALFLFSFDPNIIAHGRYVTADLIATASIFAAAIVIGWAVVRNRWLDAVWAGLAIGVAIASKLSAVFLFPVCAVLYWIRWWQEGAKAEGRRSAERMAGWLAVVAVASLMVVAVVYASDTARMFRGELPPLTQVTRSASASGAVLYAIATMLNLPGHAFLRCLIETANHNSNGDPAYLLGKYSSTGWWYYFPVAFVVKTPTAALLLILIGVGIGVAALRRTNASAILAGLRGARFELYVLAVPPILYFLSSMQSHINLGLRHILPVYPFLFVLLSAMLFECEFKRLIPVVLAAVVAIGIAEAAYIYPHYLAFFNLPSGGAAHGPRYLLDSNIDWGQDLKSLKRYLDERHVSRVCLAYFGTAPLEYYGIHAAVLPVGSDEAGRASADCVASVSVTLLYDVYVRRGTFAWLREREPIDRVGYSIYVYDLRKQARR